jgi:hypothetical protein
MLALTLESISKARGVPAKVQIHADTRANLQEITFVRDRFYPSAELFHAGAHIQAPSGCWNILNSIREASKVAETVFFIEEDVRIYPEFFEWHRAQTEVASCGRWTRFNDMYGPYYTNPGSCLRRPLLDVLLPHINDTYFIRLRLYLDKEFGTWPEMSELDDGLIRRCVKSINGTGACAFPPNPVAVHQGFHMYNRLMDYINSGDIQQRIHGLRLMHKRLTPMNRYTRDYEAYLR